MNGFVETVTKRPHEEIRPLLSAYALGALEDSEAQEVSSHLAECARCRQELRELQEAVALLASDGEPPPAELWERIRDQIRRRDEER